MKALEKGYAVFLVLFATIVAVVAVGLAEGALRSHGWALTGGALLILANFAWLALQVGRALRGGREAARWDSWLGKFLRWACFLWAAGGAVWSGLGRSM